MKDKTKEFGVSLASDLILTFATGGAYVGLEGTGGAAGIGQMMPGFGDSEFLNTFQARSILKFLISEMDNVGGYAVNPLTTINNLLAPAKLK